MSWQKAEEVTPLQKEFWTQKGMPILLRGTPLFDLNQNVPLNSSGGSRGRVQGVHTPPPPWDDLQFSNTNGILPKKKKKNLCGLLVLK